MPWTKWEETDGRSRFGGLGVSCYSLAAPHFGPRSPAQLQVGFSGTGGGLFLQDVWQQEASASPSSPGG